MESYVFQRVQVFITETPFQIAQIFQSSHFVLPPFYLLFLYELFFTYSSSIVKKILAVHEFFSLAR